MTYKEFTDRTGIYPSGATYTFIEAAYAEFNGNKDAFCEAYKANQDGLAERIALQADMDAAAEGKRAGDEIKSLKAEIARLQQENTALQGWKPYQDPDAYTQKQYDRLKDFASTAKYLGEPDRCGMITDERARDLIANEFGFDLDAIEIFHDADVFQINNAHRLRQIGTTERLPIFDVWDWNYIRFRVKDITYEMQDGDLVRIHT